MTSQELLLMLILDVLDDEKSTNIINDGVFVLGMIIYSLLIFSVITDRVFQL